MPYDNLDSIDPIENTEIEEESETDEILESLTYDDQRTEVEKKRDKKYEYREITYNKQDVADVEKKAIGEMVKIEPDLNKYSEVFITRATAFYPELLEGFELKKKRGKKSNLYFIESVGRYLWEKWNADKTPENQNDFVTYLYTIIDGVIFKYGRHKHGISYGEIFQGAVIKLIQAMDKFDPQRVVGHDEKGRPVYARVYTYFTMILNYGITTITMAHGYDKIHNMSYDAMGRAVPGDKQSVSDAAMIFQEFLIFLETYKEETEDLLDIDKKILNKLYDILNTGEDLHKIANNLIYTLQTECQVKSKEVLATMTKMRAAFGPLNIFSSKLALTQADFEQDN
jgi:hypothetical protein